MLAIQLTPVCCDAGLCALAALAAMTTLTALTAVAAMTASVVLKPLVLIASSGDPAAYPVQPTALRRRANGAHEVVIFMVGRMRHFAAVVRHATRIWPLVHGAHLINSE